MMLQPVIPLPVLAPLALAALVAAGFLCASACRGLGAGLRILCVLLLLMATGAGFALLLNPGHVEQRPSSQVPVWVVGLDVSASMAAPVEDDPEAEPRLEAGHRVVRQLGAVSDRDVRWVALARGSHELETAEKLEEISATGDASHVLSGMAGCIESLRRQGRMVAGAVLVSDGRDTHPRDWQALVSRAGAAGCPVHVVPVGSTWKAPDIAVSSRHPFILAYPGVETRLSARIRSTRMGDRQVQAELLDEEEKVLQVKTLRLAGDEEREISFTLASHGGIYRVRVADQPGEARPDNNEVCLTVREVSSRIRVFLAEGSPYWDSKFLAQYLRGQQVFDVRSVHRLSDNRFYHINSGDENSAPTETPEMPTTLDGLMGYDVIVLGKGMEHLLDEGAACALQSWVREQGGILVMARGRCYAGRLESIAELEPFIWGGLDAGLHRLVPSQEGMDSGLFGQLLPAADDPVWSSLPELEDVRSVSESRPQTRILATAENPSLPLLGLMRCGLGAVACINGEGLWKWDFYPEARANGNMYREFWRHFLPWVQTAAEFMPGFDLSLHPDRSIVQEGEGVVCQLGWRGLNRPQEVLVEAFSLSEGRVVAEQKALPVVSESLPRWECSLGALPPGEYVLRGVAGDAQQPECRFSVLPPPAEADNPDANPELLVRVAEATGGRVLPEELGSDLLETVFAAPPGTRDTEDVYRPLWAKWQALAFMALCLGGLWFIRRRKGLP